MKLNSLPLNVHTANMTDEQAKKVAADLDQRVEQNTTPCQRAALSLGLLMVAHGLMAFGDIIKIQEGRETFGLPAGVLAEIKRLSTGLIERTVRINSRTNAQETVYLVNQCLLDVMTKGGSE